MHPPAPSSLQGPILHPAPARVWDSLGFALLFDRWLGRRGVLSLSVQTHLHRPSISPAALTPWQPECTGTAKGLQLCENTGFGHNLHSFLQRPLMSSGGMGNPSNSQCSDTGLETEVKDNCCPWAGGSALSEHPEMLLLTFPRCFQGLRLSFDCFFL